MKHSLESARLVPITNFRGNEIEVQKERRFLDSFFYSFRPIVIACHVDGKKGGRKEKRKRRREEEKKERDVVSSN